MTLFTLVEVGEHPRIISDDLPARTIEPWSSWVYPEKRGKGYHVGFFYDSYWHWAAHVEIGMPFEAKKTKRYQYTGNCYTRNPRAEIRFMKTVHRQAIKALKGKRTP